MLRWKVKQRQGFYPVAVALCCIALLLGLPPAFQHCNLQTNDAAIILGDHNSGRTGTG